MSDSQRLLVLAIDAASPALLKAWAADGTLPNLARLIAGGLTGDIRSIWPFHSGSTWPSFYIGRDPAGHGIYWLQQLQAGTYRTQPVTAAEFGRRKALWEIISEAGREVLVLDVPLSRLSPQLNGRQVVEWCTHDPIFGMRTTPPALKIRILDAVGEHPAAAPCDASRRSLAEYQRFAGNLVRGATARGELTRHLLADAPWDFAIQVFNEAHCAGHQLWHFHDRHHPAFDTAIAATAGDLLRTVYAAIDSAIGTIIEQAGPETTIVVLTLHGMSHYCGYSRLLPEILTRLGVSVPRTSERPTGPSSVRERIGYLMRSLYHGIPESIRRPIYDFRARVASRVLNIGSPLPIDPRRSRCFYTDMGPLIGGIRLNLIGRDPLGTIARGADAAAFSAELIRQLLEFVDPETARPLVRRVLRTADLLHGERLDDLPDLLVEWDLERPIGSTAVGTGADAALRAFSPRTGLVTLSNAYGRTGEHTPEGMFVARGPGIVPGQLERIVSTLDMAPTFSALLGVEMTGVDGAVIPELIGR
ncbi:MAG TPA: alkaline phosphatase family protein [Gemmatimonadales bacterium]|jgi:predicted AlkP superfamily phosphohydrolase/phosphomutase